MIPAAFEYHAPATLQEAIGLLQTHGDEAKILAGGHSLLPLLKLRFASPGHVVDIGRLPGLSYIREDGDTIAIGGLTTHRDIEHSDVLKAKVPLLPEAAREVADIAVRNRGTIGGSLAHADPAADYPAAVLALNAEIVVTGPNGQRTVPIAQWFVSLLTSALAPNEVLTEVRIPVPGAGSGGAYQKVPNMASHYALVGVAAQVKITADGRCESASIGVTGAAGVPFRASGAEAALAGQALDDATIANAAEAAWNGSGALSDIHASGEYRQHLVKVHTKRAVQRAAANAAAS
jgi:carbon-monoxide dehydrogenase medium subunit